MRDEEAIVSSCLKNAAKHGSQWFGYVESAADLSEFVKQLATINVCFQTVSSHYRTTEKSTMATEGLEAHGKLRHYKREAKLMFSSNRGSVPVSLTMPFIVISQVDKGCVFGKERPNFKKQVEEHGSAADWPKSMCRKKYNKLQGTKKKGCVAMMYMKEIEMYPDYKIDAPTDCSKTKLEKLKKVAYDRLCKDMSLANENVKSCYRLYIVLDSKEAHTEHEFNEVLGLAQPINSEIVLRIRQLAREGVTSTELRESYRKSSWLTPDVPSNTISPDISEDGEIPLEETNNLFGSIQQFPHTSSKSTLGRSRKNIRSAAERCINLSFYCTDPEHTSRVEALLEECCSLLSDGAPSSSGLLLRGSPTKGCLRQKRNSEKLQSNNEPNDTAVTQVLKKARAANKKSWRTRGRVGQKTDELKKTHLVAPVVSK